MKVVVKRLRRPGGTRALSTAFDHPTEHILSGSISPQILVELQSTLDREIPMCGQMGLEVLGCDERGLTVAAPLAQNRNHQRTAFAGSLNAICSIAGWGSVFLLAREHDLVGDIVIRRSTIKYLKPVTAPQILARCMPIESKQSEYVVEMFRDKGQTKIDLRVEILSGEEVAVAFEGCYVVLGRE